MSEMPELPVELISHIFQHFTSKATLASAASCSRQWYDIAVPHLYRRVEIQHARYSGYGEPHLKSLTALFLRKPAIAAHVRHFSVRSDFNEYSQESPKTPEDDLPEVVKAAIIPATHDNEERAAWLQDRNYGDVCLAILLPSLPKLETLDIEVPSAPIHIWRMLWRIKMNEKPTSAFTNLKSLFWTHEDSTHGGYFCNGILALPSLEAIYLHRVGSEEEDFADETLARLAHEGSSKFIYLELRDCRFDSNDIRSILLTSRSLKSFILELGWGYVSFPAIREGLAKHEDSLEELWLDYGHGDILWREDNDDERPPMTSLKGFSRLKRVKIAPEFILGLGILPGVADAGRQYKLILEFLPAGIEMLQLTHCDQVATAKMLLRALEYILTRKNTYVPNLDTVIIETDYEIVNQQIDDFTRVLALADEVGIKMMLLNNSGKDKHGNDHERFEKRWGFDEDVVWRECTSLCNQRPVYEVIEVSQ